MLTNGSRARLQRFSAYGIKYLELVRNPQCGGTFSSVRDPQCGGTFSSVRDPQCGGTFSSVRNPQRGGILSGVNQRSSAWGNIIRSQPEILSVGEYYQESTRDPQRGGILSGVNQRSSAWGNIIKSQPEILSVGEQLLIYRVEIGIYQVGIQKKTKTTTVRQL